RRQRLELVGEPMAEVERPGRSHLERITVHRDVVEVEDGASLDEDLHRVQVASAQARRRTDEEIEEGTILDDRDLERLGNAAAPVLIRKRLEEVRVVDDG